MRIAQVAPLIESVPPQRYGGTERVVSYLTDELCRMGHQVTLFASGDSHSPARLIAPCPRALRLDRHCSDYLPYTALLLDAVFSRADQFDLIHFHIDYWHFPMARQMGCSQVTTLHGRLDLPGLAPVFREFQDMPLVSISKDQRAPLPFASWVKTIHHGLPEALYRFHPKGQNYFAFLGRLSREKRVDRAIHIAEALGVPLKVAAKVDDQDKDYFDTIRPLLKSPWVEFVGEITDAEKNDFLGNALGLLFPIDWPEPFGLVVIESLACGTPVVGFRRGSVSELIDDGVTGFVVDDLDGAVEAASLLPRLNRRTCRDIFERRFSARRMARDYLDVYQRIIRPHQIWAASNERGLH